jgi:hypothetical protein
VRGVLQKKEGQQGRSFDRRQVCTRNDGAGDLNVLLTSHEDENVAGRVRDVDLERLLDGAVDVVLARRLREEDVDGEGSTRDGVAGSVIVELGELLVKTSAGMRM